MARPPLACTVRGCGSRLERRDSAFVCEAGHSFDVARRGYVNLLQPQDRRSRTAGDSQAAVKARASLLAGGVGRAIINAVVGLAADALRGDPDPIVVDLGSGSGDALAALAGSRPITGIGIDLSAAAAEYAARRFRGPTWIVANADRRLPLLDRSVDLVLSLHGRRNPGECDRVLTATGALVIGLPAADDLIELRTIVQGEGIERSRGEALLAEHEQFFRLVTRSTVRETHQLEPHRLVELLHGTYRGMRRGAAERVATLGTMTVTLSSDVFVLARR